MGTIPPSLGAVVGAGEDAAQLPALQDKDGFSMAMGWQGEGQCCSVGLGLWPLSEGL